MGCQSAGGSPYRSKRVCCLLRIDGLDSKTCGRFRFLPVATAAAAAIPTGPGNQITKGESVHTAQERARKDIAIVPSSGKGPKAQLMEQGDPNSPLSSPAAGLPPLQHQRGASKGSILQSGKSQLSPR